ncbi:MAG: isoprenyl transferase [Candidatus Neomarinimicrobiota bacterium]
MTKLDSNNLPNHIAIIMDGNGRWAKSKMLPRAIGHKNGVKTVRLITELCSKMNIKHLTLYTLSIENFNRPKSEINNLMKLLSSSIRSEVDKMKDNNIKFNIFGFQDKLTPEVNSELDYAILETKNNSGLCLNLALAYSSRYEIVNAIKNISQDILDKKTNINDIDENKVNDYLLTKGTPDPDLLIRTGGEDRLSNFLLWQSAYTEIHFSNKFWPDFNEKDLNKALIDYQSRVRKFGRIKN